MSTHVIESAGNFDWDIYADGYNGKTLKRNKKVLMQLDGSKTVIYSHEPYAQELYNMYMQELKALGVADVQSGEFGADMLCEINNDGPVTIILDTDTWKR